MVAMVKPQLTPSHQAPSRFKLGACLMYEALTVLAMSMLLAWLFLLLVGDASHGVRRLGLQLFLYGVVGVYFAYCWSRRGQTLAMRAWRIQVVDAQHQAISFVTAYLRYVLASLSLMLLGLGFLWALVDKDRCFLHDRLLNTRLIARV